MSQSIPQTVPTQAGGSALGYYRPRREITRSPGLQLGADRVLTLLTAGSALTVLLMLFALVAVLFVAAIPSIRQFGFAFLTSSTWRPNEITRSVRTPEGKLVRDEDGEIVTETLPPSFGAAPVIFGTAVSSIIALLVAVPLSIGAALFLTRISPRGFAAPISFLIEFLAAIPSIAFGLWGLFVMTPFLQRHMEPLAFKIYERLPGGSWLMLLLLIVCFVAMCWFVRKMMRKLAANLSPWETLGVVAAISVVLFPTLYFVPAIGRVLNHISNIDAHLLSMFGNPPGLGWMFAMTYTTFDGQVIIREIAPTGRDMLCGGLILGIMIIPIITALARDVLKTVPRTQIEGSLALGATWWQSCKEMLKYSRAGLFGAVMLGLARAAGETMAIAMVIGNISQITASPFMAAQTMSSLLANEFAEANDALHQSSLVQVALILLLMSLAFNIFARWLVVGGSARSARGH